jgi:outer membrane protein assembly factor BamB
VRIDRTGSEVWDCRLPGYVMLHPAVHGSVAVVQTRGGSYGGQATSGVDLETGERLWSEVVDAYGCGAAFAADGSLVVEADQWLSPRATEGWLIGREPATGKRLWHHRRPSNTISQWPLVDPTTGRVFAAFDRGDVVCLEGKDGSVVWETFLPEPTYREVAFSYDPYWPCIARHGDRIMVLDRNRVLHLLDAATGRPAARIAPTAVFSRDGRTMAPVEIVATPWIHEGKLIVATAEGVVAFELDELERQWSDAWLPGTR